MQRSLALCHPSERRQNSSFRVQRDAQILCRRIEPDAQSPAAGTRAGGAVLAVRGSRGPDVGGCRRRCPARPGLAEQRGRLPVRPPGERRQAGGDLELRRWPSECVKEEEEECPLGIPGLPKPEPVETAELPGSSLPAGILPVLVKTEAPDVGPALPSLKPERSSPPHARSECRLRTCPESAWDTRESWSGPAERPDLGSQLPDIKEENPSWRLPLESEGLKRERGSPRRRPELGALVPAEDRRDSRPARLLSPLSPAHAILVRLPPTGTARAPVQLLLLPALIRGVPGEQPSSASRPAMSSPGSSVSTPVLNPVPTAVSSLVSRPMSSPVPTAVSSTSNHSVQSDVDRCVQAHVQLGVQLSAQARVQLGVQLGAQARVQLGVQLGPGAAAGARGSSSRSGNCSGTRPPAAAARPAPVSVRCRPCAPPGGSWDTRWPHAGGGGSVVTPASPYRLNWTCVCRHRCVC
ncbi:uncharacterized protein [Lepisosteus oculatus]|uniref:uncharacterized protein n=1 Tax=Lepisosteus oculatus TaxID=7918 RepID=UPI0035F500B6